MKTVYFETIDSPSGEIYKIYAYGVYPEAIWYKLTLSFKERDIYHWNKTLLSIILSPICKYQTLSLIRVFQRTSQTHMNTHASINIYM